jgi:hypothetical protein
LLWHQCITTREVGVLHNPGDVGLTARDYALLVIWPETSQQQQPYGLKLTAVPHVEATNTQWLQRPERGHVHVDLENSPKLTQPGIVICICKLLASEAEDRGV